MTPYKRELGTADKIFIAVNEIRPPFVIQLVLQGHGDPAPEALYEALTKTTEANPGSSLRLDRAQDEDNWVLGPAPTMTIVDAPEFTGDSHEHGPFFMWPLDAYTGPTCELVYVRGKTANHLVFRALHAVMDGQGTLLWVKDFMRCLRGEEPIGHASPIGFDTLLREISPDKAREAPGVNALHPFGPAKPETLGQYHWRRVKVDRPLDSAALGRIAVSLGKRARKNQSGAVRMNLPTDLRHYAPKERTTANFFTSLMLEVPPEASAQMLGLKIVQMLYKEDSIKPVGRVRTEDKVVPLDLVRVKTLWDMNHLHDTGLYGFSATLSHLGVLKSEALSAPDFQTESVCFVPLVGDSGCVVAINGVDDHCVACVGLSDRFSGDGQLDEFAALLTQALGGEKSETTS